MEVVFDSSFLMAVIEQPTTWLQDITTIVGKVEPVVLKCTLEELSRISKGDKKRSRTATLALTLAKEFRVETSGGGKVDDELVSHALGRRSMVATVDRELVRTLKGRKVGVIGLRMGRVALL